MRSGKRPVLGMVLKGYPRISETFISNEILLLEELGFDIHIFSMRHPREDFSHESVKRIRAEVTYLPETFFTSLHKLLPPNIALVFKRPRAYARAFRLMLRRFKRRRKLACIKHLLQGGYLVEKGMKGRGVSHLHAQFAHSPTSVTMYAAMLSGIEGSPFSFTAHAKDIYTQDRTQLAEKIAQARFVVTCTGYNQHYLQELAPEGKPVHRVYHGIDLGLFAMNGRGPAAQAPYTILTVARLVRKKGLPTVFEALKILRDKGVDFRYVLIGSGEEKAEVKALIRDLGLEDITEMPGTMPHEKVLEYYRQADLFALGCRVTENGDRDGIPNVLVESMAMGVPVVATGVSAIPELVENGKTGLLVESGDAAGMAGAMERLLTDGTLRARVIPAARAKVIRDFDNRALIIRLGRIYQEQGIGPEVLRDVSRESEADPDHAAAS